MKTDLHKKYHYTYYSYEEFGRGYIGVRSCNCKPEEDVKYFGSFSDKSFLPTSKIILGIYETREDANKDERILHRSYDVRLNPNFANKHNANDRFCNTEYLKNSTPEQRSEVARKREASKTPEQRSERGRKAAASMTPEQRSEASRKAAASMTPEQRSEAIRKGRASMTPEQRSQAARKREASMTAEQREKARENLAIARSHRWQCTITGFTTNAGNLSRYQKARGIDTSNRVRLPQEPLDNRGDYAV
jgi:hypothetical protein